MAQPVSQPAVCSSELIGGCLGPRICLDRFRKSAPPNRDSITGPSSPQRDGILSEVSKLILYADGVYSDTSGNEGNSFRNHIR
jgi:hypothetical protein